MTVTRPGKASDDAASAILRMTMAQPAPLQLSAKRTAAGAAGWLLSTAAAVALAIVAAGAAAQARPSQYDVEAAYLLDFGKFTQMPAAPQAQPHTTFDICIVGRDTIGLTIDQLAVSEQIDGRVVRILRDEDAAQARTCDIAFIGAQDGDAIRRDLNALAGADVLTVGDSPDFLRDGGMIQFVVQRQRVRFAVNLNAVRRTRLALSSELLRVALYVQGRPQPGGAP